MGRKILTVALSLVAAFSLWVYVVTVVSPEYEDTYRDIPVVFQGKSVLEDRDLMLIMEETPTVTLHLSGNRSDLSKLSSANITVTVDLSKVYEAGTPELNYSVSYPGNVPNDAVTVLNRAPSGVKVQIVERDSKPVPVEVVFQNTLPQDYIKEKPEFDVPTILVTGPKETVANIQSAQIVVDLENVTETIIDSYSYTLYDTDGNPVDTKYLHTDVQNVMLTLPIQKVKEIPLKLDVIYGGGATQANTKITMDYESVLISGSEAQLEDLTELLIGKVDLTQLAEDTVLTFPIKLEEGITNETGITEVNVTVDLPDLETKTIKVTNIAALNIPANTKVVISTQEIDIKVRGTKANLENITEADLTVTVDFSKAANGTGRYDAVVTISTRFPDVGVVGTYTVLANVTTQ